MNTRTDGLGQRRPVRRDPGSPVLLEREGRDMGWIVRGWMSSSRDAVTRAGVDFEHTAQYLPDVHEQVKAAAGLGCVVIEIEKDTRDDRR